MRRPCARVAGLRKGGEPVIKPIRQTFQAHKGVDTPCATYIRDDEGRVDLGPQGETPAPELTVAVRGYRGQHVLAVWPATGNELGKVEFTVPAGHKLPSGLYRLEIVAKTDAGTVLAQGALLEVV